jgi:hypothetical protein
LKINGIKKIKAINVTISETIIRVAISVILLEEINKIVKIKEK